MNDPTAQPIDIHEQRTWLIDHRAGTGFTWSELAKRTGIPQGTISQFGSAKGYAGDEQKVAEAVFRYRQQLNQQASLTTDLPEVPGFFETQTSRELTSLLAWAKRGRIVCAATGAGIGKTQTARQFQACFPQVFYASMKPSSAGVNTMQIEVLKAMGDRSPKGTPLALTQRIIEIARGSHLPLLIIDEAQHLSEKAVEEIRGWNDEAGLGIALFGNIKVLRRIEGGGRDDAFAQLYSRLSMRMVRPLPLQADAIALAEAWQIFDSALTDQVVRIAMHPGGLRGATMALEIASMIAAAERRPLAVDDLRDAWTQLSSRGGAA